MLDFVPYKLILHTYLIQRSCVPRPLARLGARAHPSRGCDNPWNTCCLGKATMYICVLADLFVVFGIPRHLDAHTKKASLVVTFRNLNKHFWSHCPGQLLFLSLSLVVFISCLSFLLFYIFPRYLWRSFPFIAYLPLGRVRLRATMNFILMRTSSQIYSHGSESIFLLSD